jgi:hypothetical protein
VNDASRAAASPADRPGGGGAALRLLIGVLLMSLTLILTAVDGVPRWVAACVLVPGVAIILAGVRASVRAAQTADDTDPPRR